MAISLFAYVSSFSEQLCLRRSYFFTLHQSNYFDTTATFSEQLFLQRICFFLLVPVSEQLILRNSYFFRIATFSQRNSNKKPPIVKRKFIRVVTVQNSCFFGEGIVQNKDIYRRAAFSKHVFLHSINYFRRATFWKKVNFYKKQYSVLSTFLEGYLQSGYFFKRIIFYSSYLFKRAIFYNILFQKSYHFTAMLPFHSYISCLSAVIK